MMAGRQWLGFSVALVLFAVVIVTFGNSAISWIFSPGVTPTASSSLTLQPVSPTNTGTVIQTSTRSGHERGCEYRC